MATVRLYFEPYPEDDADQLRIEESADGVSGWSEIENISAIGTFPNWISSFTTSNATSVDYWFRIRWAVGGVPQNYSEPLQVGDLAPKYTTPDLIKDTSRFPLLVALDTLYIQELIDQAYFMVQNECGPFDELNPDFIEVAPLAMRLYVEQLSVTQDPTNSAIYAGVLEEKIGSYRYRKSDLAITELAEKGGELPVNISALICRFGLGDGDTAVETISTTVFPETPWFDGDEEDLDKRLIVTSADPDEVAIDTDSQRFGKFPSV